MKFGKKKKNKNEDFKAFKKNASYFLKPNSKVIFKGYDLIIDYEFKKTFPKLSLLILKARITLLNIDEESYILFAWDRKDNQICGWLNKIEKPNSSKYKLIEEHELLIGQIGGILESFNEPENSFSNSQNFMFTGSECTQGIEEWGEYYDMLCEDNNYDKIDSSNYITFVCEANGSFTMYEPTTKEVFLFSHDHDFDYVDFLDNQAKYTFHKFKNIITFVDYVEELANQWNEIIK